MIKGSRADHPHVMAVSSGGGHWVELLRLRPAFDGCRTTFVTVDAAYRADLNDDDRLLTLPDATAWSKVRLAWLAIRAFLLVVRERPDVVVTTGAAPGYFVILFAKRLGAKTVWVDSIANVTALSRAGELASRHATVTLTQWAHLADGTRVSFEGAVV